MWSLALAGAITATTPAWGSVKEQQSPSLAAQRETSVASVDTRSEDTRDDRGKYERRPKSPKDSKPPKRKRTHQSGEETHALARYCAADLRTFTPHMDVGNAVLPPPPPPPPRGKHSVGTALALAPPGGNRIALLGQLLELLAGDVSGSRGSRANTTITSFVHNETPEPTSEFEYAHRINEDVENISDPHLLLSVLKSVEKRIETLRKRR